MMGAPIKAMHFPKMAINGDAMIIFLGEKQRRNDLDKNLRLKTNCSRPATRDPGFPPFMSR